MAVGAAMFDFLASNEARLVILFSIVAALVAVGCYVILKFRPGRDDEGPLASKLITDFRELHSRGALSDDEFGAVKSVLSDQLQQEMKSDAKTPEQAAKPSEDTSRFLQNPLDGGAAGPTPFGL
jgi:hypothetical protein